MARVELKKTTQRSRFSPDVYSPHTASPPAQYSHAHIKDIYTHTHARPSHLSTFVHIHIQMQSDIHNVITKSSQHTKSTGRIKGEGAREQKTTTRHKHQKLHFKRDIKGCPAAFHSILLRNTQSVTYTASPPPHSPKTFKFSSNG